MKTTTTIRSIDPKLLTQSQFQRLNEVTQDMWAEGIWEFVQCNCCQKMMSKQDIFWHLEKEVYDETVKKIMWILSINEIPCISCGWETKFVYWKDNVETIRERLLKSSDSFLVIWENSLWDIIWYMDGYVNPLESIYKRELLYHYEDIGFPEINKRVEKILWKIPENMISFSSMWLLWGYANFFTIFHMYKHFSQTVPLEYLQTPGITELDKNNNLYFIYKNMLSKSLGISENEELKIKIKNTWVNYESDIVIFEHPLKNFLEQFSHWIKHFLKMTRV